MARLKKHQKLALQRQWLNIWEAAGSPALNQTVYSIKSLGFVQQKYGRTSKMVIYLGDTDISSLLAELVGEHLGQDKICLDQDKTINVYPGSSFEIIDKLVLTGKAYAVHKAAALAHRHVEAIRAIDPALADRMEIEAFVEALPARGQGAVPPSGGRL